ncbi:MAG: hypothetical protein IJD92_05235 [Bacilli bacterium]|nr:hypothetical protein [Bacilli bacterium]
MIDSDNNDDIFENERNLRKKKYLEKEFELAIKSNIFEIRIIHINKETLLQEYKKTKISKKLLRYLRVSCSQFR